MVELSVAAQRYDAGFGLGALAGGRPSSTAVGTRTSHGAPASLPVPVQQLNFVDLEGTIEVTCRLAAGATSEIQLYII